jgi:hypothetical protein
MKRLRYQGPTLGTGLMIALTISIVAGVFGYYCVWFGGSLSTDANTPA